MSGSVRVRSRVEDACCHAALRRLFPKAAKAGRKVERYPTRIIFCAYMIKVCSPALCSFHCPLQLSSSFAEQSAPRAFAATPVFDSSPHLATGPKP